MALKRSTRGYAIAGYAVILMTFGVFGGWAYSARIDSAVIAPGQVALEGDRRQIQHFEGGIVRSVHVREGARVGRGDVLVSLSAVQAASDVEVLEGRARIARAVAARLEAERRGADAPAFPDPEGDAAAEAAITDQRAIFEDRASILASQVEILSSRTVQLTRQIEGIALQRDALERRLAIAAEAAERAREGAASGAVTGNQLASREDALIQVEAQLGQAVARIAEAETAIGETELQILQIRQQYRERAGGELEAIRAELAEIEERLIVARDRLERTEIRTPVSGTVQTVAVNTVGAVVSPGEVLMEIVPAEEQLVVNARVAPTDIDSVAPGLEAEVRFTAFAAQLTPVVLGTVGTVSSDVIDPGQGQEPYFLARIMVLDVAVPAEMEGRIGPGMPADVVIATGERRVASYLTAPLVEAVRRAWREE